MLIHICFTLTDLTLSILHPVNDKVNQMDTSFEGNIGQTKELKSSLGSITSQVNQLRGDVNGKLDLVKLILFYGKFNLR